ncbi:D-inositol-3-phosphate glycosyltransferase [Austwickia sp. TVS 96-490-7B]|uniref:glycosyltransferase n=1 Tax=Austwickia sp. TVS 96-490-7B TaxID=2830843 RepID=UPI001C569104|nr:glycosyltransferase [Austwickia sp. TVS 96-490-7B]MBW3085883.1 D-inositol-3-phosphate glycosyltransferase [Austwickia sp. TVS 96-490-7B]
MKVWVVAGEYPSVEHPGRGPFVADQVTALLEAGHQVRVISCVPPSLRPVANTVLRPAAHTLVSTVRPTVQGLLGLAGGPKETRRAAAPEKPVPPASTTTEASAGGRSSVRHMAGVAVHAVRGTARVVHDAAGTTMAVRRMVQEMEQLAEQEGLPDVIHAHNVFPAGIAAGQFAVAQKLPYVVTEHMSAYMRGQYSAVELAAAIRVLDRAAAVIAVSSIQAEALPIPTDRVRVVPNVVMVDRFRQRSPQAATSGAVVAIGTLTPRKRLDSVVQAYAALPEELRQAHPLRVLGRGPEQGALRELAVSLGLSADVVEGGASREAVAQALSNAAVVVSASMAETFGVVLIEALSCGVPFVAVDSGGPRDIWAPGMGRLVGRRVDPALPDVEVFFVVEAPEDVALLPDVVVDGPGRRGGAAPESVAALSEALATTLTEGSDAAQDKVRRQSAIDRFGPNAVATALEHIYREVASAR